MTSSIIAQRHDQSHQNAIQGHCSKCHRVWTLTEPQGVCQWCGKTATCQTATTKPRRETSRRRKREQSNGIGNGYDQLPEPHLTYYKVARYFVFKVRPEDREDFLHDLMIEMAKVKAKYELIGKPLTEAGLMRVASYQVTEYWERLRRLTTWLDCGNCSKKQRRKCREKDLYSECPKYHQLVSLNTTVNNVDGEPTELIDFLADDKAIDLDLKLDASNFLLGFPHRAVKIGYKIYSGVPLDNKDKMYISRFRKQTQKPLL